MDRKPLVYLASPYFDDRGDVMEARADLITSATARIIAEQDAIIPFSPIAYTHQFAHIQGIGWYEWDLQFLERCDAMLVVQIQGWDKSKGVGIEKHYCAVNRIPVFYALPEDVVEQCRKIGIYLSVSPSPLSECRFCGAVFPNAGYLDDDGVCGSEVCQNKEANDVS